MRTADRHRDERTYRRSVRARHHRPARGGRAVAAGGGGGVRPLRVAVDSDSGVAPWRQIYDQIERMITGGTLPPGARLPTIRQLARDLGLASGTVARVYRELETVALVTTGRAKGTTVTEPGVRKSPAMLLYAEAARLAGPRT